MLQIKENISLKPFNTFGIKVNAKQLSIVSQIGDLQLLIDEKYLNGKKLILGGGSNILLTKDFDGIVVKNELLGKVVVCEDENHAYVKAGAGEVWHDFVLWCIQQNFSGIENMSLIPGSVGASPMQNIGAYGVEIKDVFHELEAIYLETGQLKTFTNSECNFGYRESVFKNIYKDQFIITSVTYRLNKKPNFNTSYGAINQQLEQMGVKDLSIKAISDAVIAIRSSKLPDPKQIGNSGSFFKNPVIDNEKFAVIKEKHPNIAAYPGENNQTKVAAGWLIEQAGWKGKTLGNGTYGVHKNQALVLVNYGGATGNEIYQLSEDIINSVKEKFDIELHREVNIL